MYKERAMKDRRSRGMFSKASVANLWHKTILWSTKVFLDSKELICMQDASGIHLQQCDRRQSCHGVCQQVKLTGISQASKSFQGLRSDREIQRLGYTWRLFQSNSSLLFQGFGQTELGGVWRFKRQVWDQKITGMYPEWGRERTSSFSLTYSLKVSLRWWSF